jgi:hypothetical protein
MAPALGTITNVSKYSACHSKRYPRLSVLLQTKNIPDVTAFFKRGQKVGCFIYDRDAVSDKIVLLNKEKPTGNGPFHGCIGWHIK